MKKYIVSLVIVASFIAISCGTAETSNHTGTNTEQVSGTYSNVSVTELNNAVNQGSDIIVLDVRTPGEVAQGYVSSAQFMDINNANFRSQATNLDTSKTVYVYCRSGVRSQKASKVLIDMGFTDVRNVEGGFNAWLQSGYKTVK